MESKELFKRDPVVLLLRHVIFGILFLCLWLGQSSCQKCRECQTVRNGALVDTKEWCRSGPGASEDLRMDEDYYRQLHNGSDEIVTCRDK